MQRQTDKTVIITTLLPLSFGDGRGGGGGGGVQGREIKHKALTITIIDTLLKATDLLTLLPDIIPFLMRFDHKEVTEPSTNSNGHILMFSLVS